MKAINKVGGVSAKDIHSPSIKGEAGKNARTEDSQLGTYATGKSVNKDQAKLGKAGEPMPAWVGDSRFLTNISGYTKTEVTNLDPRPRDFDLTEALFNERNPEFSENVQEGDWTLQAWTSRI